jgi:hypothetical protein
MPHDMSKIIKDLFPICRSITGPGIQKSLKYLENIVPEFRRLKFKTGSKVFDWKIPKEWNINDAYVKDLKNKKIIDFKKNNLHLVNFSSPIKKRVKKEELIKHIFTLKNQPLSIPYVTSYYKKNWGFCITEKQKKKLKDKFYDVFIDSKLKKGNLHLSHAIFKGKSEKEIFFSSYLCHPSMANNELSGPAVLIKLAHYISKKKKLKFSYRFVLLPETIGSIAYLSRFKNILKKKMICGYNISCVGDEGHYSHIQSKYGNSLADISIEQALINKKKTKQYSFLNRGSDERQYCAPGIDLPVCGFSRSKYGEYPEYHTHKDNLNFISQRGLNNSYKVLKFIVDNFEKNPSWNKFPKTKVLCEPNLGKRNLYPSISQKKNYNNLNLRMDLITYSDGKKNLLQISKIINQPIKKINKEIKILLKNKIIEIIK